jgi:hypothetical protein
MRATKKNNMTRVFGTVDFEYLHTKSPRESWFAVCVMIADYPKGSIKASKTFKVNLARNQYETSDFWRHHQPAYNQNISSCVTETREKNEALLADYVDDIRKQYPHIFFISDNPQMDIRLLDTILEEHQRYPISLRFLEDGKQIYYPTLCTWTYKLATQQLIGVRYFYNYQYPRRGVDLVKGTRHTPMVDCARILSCHFHALDLHREVLRNTYSKKKYSLENKKKGQHNDVSCESYTQ